MGVSFLNTKTFFEYRKLSEFYKEDSNSCEVNFRGGNLKSLLFLPGNRPDMMLKALKAEVDALIFDLEDSVPHDEKESARLEVAKIFGSQPQKSVYVRINSLDSSLAIEDIRFLSKLSLAGFVVPKIISLA